MEAIAGQARETFGETLPKDFLSPGEYQIYERLYGPPSATTQQEDINLLLGIERDEEVDAEDAQKNVLMRENQEGKLEEVSYEEEDEEAALYEEANEEEVGDPNEGTEEVKELDAGTETKSIGKSESEAEIARSEMQEEFQGRFTVYRDIAVAKAAVEARTTDGNTMEKEVESSEEAYDERMDSPTDDLEEDAHEGKVEEGNAYERSIERAHPLTTAGQFGTSPATIHLPRDTFVDAIGLILADASNKHLKEVSEKTFGGPGLPTSTSTITRPHLKQEPIALEASQFKMGEMEGNAYLAAIMPGTYASVMSTLVEVRKRLGSDWLRGLMRKREGPRVLDAGAGGAGVLAWREVLRAEWESMHEDHPPPDRPVPYGRSTVVTGSSSLRRRASKLLDNTTFIPRLPDYDPKRDHPSLEARNPQPRNQYDIILAPHTLWHLKEEHLRKSQIQNFWSLLDPRGGVLILLEKGIPRGFELIASARETLLKHHIPSSSPAFPPHTKEPHSGPTERGMILAPCTNHAKCPMYIHPVGTKGRKDHCHFSQRYIRPPFLQRILGHRDRNHEDIKFSYLALQRGLDLRTQHHPPLTQDTETTLAAFAGYESTPPVHAPSPFTLPRAILPPIKSDGHIILDLCTPAATIERWTVPQSFSKQAYRDARKSRWGDLWALGAKTRVKRNIRVGNVGGKGGVGRRGVGDEEGTRGVGDQEGGAVREMRRGRGMRKRKGKGKGKFRRSGVISSVEELGREERRSAG